MKFLCGSCRTKYQISDEKVRGKILTIRCKKCGAKVMVKESLQRQASIAVAPIADEDAKAEAPAGKVAVGGSAASQPSLSSAFDVAMGASLDDMPTSIAPTPANEADAGVEWYVAVDGAQQGPFAYAELVQRIKTKDFVGRHYVWHDGFDNWKRVRDVPDLAQYIAPDPKKKPPPPPPAQVEAPVDPGAKVVDFAQKRAERDRKGRESLSPEEVEAGAISEPPTAQGRAASRADRAEQLDSVLNEALGIGGEGQTAKSEAAKAEQKALGAALAQGASLTNDFASEPSDSFLPEDIFDNVPRASAQEMVARENTRFFVQAAGVNSQKSKNRAGVIGGAAIAALLFSFVGAWAAGWIQISIPGIGNPFQNMRAEEPVEDEGTADLSAEEKKLLEGLSGAEKKAQIKKVRSRRKPVASAGTKIEYADNDLPGSGAAGSRGHDEGAGTVGIDIEKGGGAGPSGAVGDHSLPTSDPTLPAIETGKLDEKALRQVINENKTAVATCYQRELKGNQDLKGRLDFLVTVSPTGSVSRVSINSPQFRQTALAQCIADKIKVWRFPAFQGAEVQVIVPFVLARSS